MSHDIGSESVADLKQSPPSVNQPPVSPHADSMGAFSPSMNHVFFSGADRRILLDEVIHLCQFGNNLVATIGGDGTGKTSFLNQARFELSGSALCCLINSRESMTPEDIFSQVITQLGLSAGEASSAGEMIATLRHSIAEGNMQRVIVIVDDAHTLSDGILSALISLLQGQQGQHLHILMGGEVSLVERLDHFDMVDVLVYDVTLNPFTREQVKEYLDFKLTAAGYSNEKLLSEAQVDSVWKESRGYPAQINVVAEKHIFQQDFEDNEGDPTASGLPLIHMALLVALLAALILALIYMGGDGEEASDVLIDGRKSIEVPVDVNLGPQPIVENGGVNPSIIASDNIELTSDSGRSSGVIEPNKDLLAVRAQKKGAAGDGSITGVSAESKGEVDTLPVKPTGSAKLAVDSASLPQNSPPALRNSLTQELKKEVERLDVGESRAKPKERPVPKKTESPSLGSVKSSLPVRSTASNKVAQTISKPSTLNKSSSLSNDEKWLLSLNDSDYVLQVIAAGQKQSVQKFISSQPNKNGLRLIGVGRGSQPWYIVVTGRYSDGVSARRAIQSLPQDQVNGGPWPRKVSDLKQKFREFRNK